MSNQESKIEKAGYNFGRNVLGPILYGILMMFIFALPIWIIWDSTVCDIFPMLNSITYLEAFSLCAITWCFSRVWKGAPDGKN